MDATTRPLRLYPPAVLAIALVGALGCGGSDPATEPERDGGTPPFDAALPRDAGTPPAPTDAGPGCDEELRCPLTEGVCVGAEAQCVDGAPSCGYGADYEADETACDGLDNDCDGRTDESCACTDGATQACGSDAGACAAGTQTCTDGAWGACEDEVGPSAEICDGLDNDCDGDVDEQLAARDCAEQRGVCAGSRASCGGTSGFASCGAAERGASYEATESSCDELDNDCDGTVDEGCACTAGDTQPCGSAVGVCERGTQTCTDGAWGACLGETTGSAETCDGRDEDCDGATDEGLTAPACALTSGVCAGARATCGGSSGFGACGAAQYGPHYEGTESSCDGRDNDCDGDTDEGCECVDGATQTCGVATGACASGTQTCTGGAWGACGGGVGAAPETCNGVDDDCDGVTDEDLSAPACPLTDGTCAGATRSCLGSAGWGTCASGSAYGPWYVSDEAGATRTDLCDAIDNDCDGDVDEGCATRPLMRSAQDLVSPDMRGELVVYLSNADGNFDVYAHHVGIGHTMRITSTPEDEHAPVVGRSLVAYTRGDGAARRVYTYDLASGVERAVSSRRSDDPALSEHGTVAWAEHDGTQWDLYVYDADDPVVDHVPVHQPGGTPANERHPSLFARSEAFVTYLSDVRSPDEVRWAAWWENAFYDEASDWPMTSSGITTARNVEEACWTDRRNVTGATPTETDDWEVYCTRPAGAYLDSASIAPYATGPGAQLVDDVNTWVGVSDHRNGNWDPAIGERGGASVLLTTDPAAQRNVTSGNDVLVWQDARLGTWDLFTTRRAFPPPLYASGSFPPVTEFTVHVRDAGLSPSADLDGDGSVDADDQYVELSFLEDERGRTDLSGARILVDGTVRHVFPAGTTLRTDRMVIFGGAGGFAGHFGGAEVLRASTGSLGLSAAGSTIEVQYASGATATSESVTTDDDTPGWEG